MTCPENGFRLEFGVSEGFVFDQNYVVFTDVHDLRHLRLQAILGNFTKKKNIQVVPGGASWVMLLTPVSPVVPRLLSSWSYIGPTCLHSTCLTVLSGL